MRHLPPVLAGQFYVTEAVHKEQGFRAPVAAVTWAQVSGDVDRRLADAIERPIRLRPDEWTSGENFWIVDVAGHPPALSAALAQLRQGPLKGRSVKLRLAILDGKTSVGFLDQLDGAV